MKRIVLFALFLAALAAAAYAYYPAETEQFAGMALAAARRGVSARCDRPCVLATCRLG